MKLSLNWLNNYLTDQVNWDDVLHKLTMAGIEIESVTSVNIAADSSDKIIEFKVTPNRGDCLSVLGILREIAVLIDVKVNFPPQSLLYVPAAEDQIAIKVNEHAKCPNYLALVVKGIDNNVQLPQLILSRLESSGIRSISPVVDITNYVMLELGQPLHAFDKDQIGDLLQVRLAISGEKLKLLDGGEVSLTNDTLVICDANNQVVAIAGVMGGESSSVISSTKNIVLESAFFIPEVIAGRAKHYGVSSDSAYRFERGVDPKLQELAIKYTAALIIQYCGGQIGTISTKIDPHITKNINLKYKTITSLLGMKLTTLEINNILDRLGFVFIQKNDNEAIIEVPSHRFDINILEDIVEEVARVYGYDRILPVDYLPGKHRKRLKYLNMEY